MSDLVLVALIAGVPGLTTVILGFINNILVRRDIKHTKETKEAIKSVVEQTNGIKDALVVSTEKAARAEGNLEGRAELKRESERL